MQQEKQYCERCRDYKVVSTMFPKKIELKELREKMKKGKIENISYLAVYVGYTYFECPICHWFKFILKK
jgi:hypothetical protein